MNRYVFPVPGPVAFPALLGELRAVDPSVVDCNDVAGQVAVYAPGAVDTEALGAVVAAHGGPPLFPPLDATGALATLLVVQGVLPLVDASAAVGEEPAHLVHEAEAWQVAALP